MTTSKTNLKYFQLKGTIYYAHVKEPDTKGEFPTNKYKAELSVDDKTAERLTSLGVLVKNKQDVRGKFVSMKSTFQPTVTIADENNTQQELTPDAIPLIGNGSEVIITATLYDNKAKQGGKKCLGLSKIDVIKLIEYKAPLLTDLDSLFE